MRTSLLGLLLVVCSCQIDKDKGIDRDKFTFKTGDDTELFFKNMRQSYYDLEENQAAKFNVFRFKKRIQDDSKAILNLAIVINYLQDEAYILLEPSGSLTNDPPWVVNWADTVSNTSGQFKLEAMNRDNMLEFGTLLFEGIEQNYTFTLAEGTPFLNSSKEREAIRITMTDYYRLTRIF